jgi:hypothetical protein
MSGSEEFSERLINCISRVGDLDLLHALVSNRVGDSFASQLRDWTLDCLRIERMRRAGLSEPGVYFRTFRIDLVPDDDLVATAIFGLGLLQSATVLEDGGILAFAMQLQKQLTAHIGHRLLSTPAAA